MVEFVIYAITHVVVALMVGVTCYYDGKHAGAREARDASLVRLNEEYSRGWKAGRSNGIEHQKALIQEFLDDTDE